MGDGCSTMDERKWTIDSTLRPEPKIFYFVAPTLRSDGCRTQSRERE